MTKPVVSQDYSSHKNTVQQIKASAGSGKTHTIINTLLNLFSQDSTDLKKIFSSILAITFTNAAASDMKSKLIARLKNIALELEEKDENLKLQKQEAIQCINGFIAHYSTLNIRTIDSFLFMLLKQSTLNLHLPPSVEPMFSTEDFFNPLLDQLALLSLHKELDFSEDDAFSANSEFAKLLRPRYDEMYKALFYSEPQKGFLGLGRIREKIFSTIRALQSITISERSQLSSHEILIKNYESSLKTFKENILSLQTLIDDNSISTFAPYRNAYSLLFDNNKLSSFFQADKDELFYTIFQKKAVTFLQDEANVKLAKKIDSALYAITESYRLAFLLSTSKGFAPVIEFCKLILEIQVHEEFSKGKILSERIPLVLHELLESDEALLPLILQQLPYELESVLIDEFQDTSDAQWQIIRAFSADTLSRGGNFTYVGDVKQAIYSWRGGNSFLFEGILKELKGEIQKQSLGTNWRSSKEVIEFNNTVFSQFKTLEFSKEMESLLCPPDTLFDSPFAQELSTLFNDVAQQVSAKHEKNTYGRVALYDVNVEHSGRGKPSNEVVYAAVQEKLFAAIDDSHTRYDYKDMAILVRKNSHCELCASWLTEQKIPVITEGALNLASNPLVMQCISMLEYLKDTSNEHALWHICAFEGLFDSTKLINEEQFLQTKAKTDNTSNLVHACLEENSSYLFELINKYKENSAFANVYALLCMIVDDCELYTRYNKQSGFIACLLELALKAQSKGIYTIHSFLEYWYEQGQEEKIPMPEGINAVRILTVHKSKGAEFDVCFVWNDLSKPMKPSGLKFYQIDKLSFFSQHSKYHQDYIKDVRTQALEAINLLYVAFTRAKNELHILYRTTNQGNSPLERLLDASLSMSKKDETLKAYIHSESEIPAPKLKKSNEENAILLPVMQYRIPKLNFEELQEEKEAILTAHARGKIIHTCFEHYFKLCKLDRDCDKKIISMFLAKTLLAPNERNDLKNELEQAFAWVKNLADFEGWLQEEILSEQNLVDKNNRLLRCDLCLVNQHHVHVIDFKTGQENEKYKKQISLYINALKAMNIYKAYTFSGSLLYLDKQIIQTITHEG